MCVMCGISLFIILSSASSHIHWHSHTPTLEELPNADVFYVDYDISHAVDSRPSYGDNPEPPDRHYPVKHAGLPQGLTVYPLPLENSDHELSFNVSWMPPLGTPATDYSLEVRSMTDTVDCHTPMCYDYNIPGEMTWWLIPAYSSPVAETCAVRPGCSYMVKLIAHPWDGLTSANMMVRLDECVQNVCSCAHTPRLPAPAVSAQTVTIQGEMFANITWSLPHPQYPQRLPAGLRKKNYIVSLGKQMISDAHPAPWFANIIVRNVDADGLVSEGDSIRSILLPVSERSFERSFERSGERKIQRTGEQSLQSSEERRSKRVKSFMPEVKLLARVNLMDDRDCVGPAGNATAFNPATDSNKFSFGTYAIVLIVGGAWILGVVFVLSARVVKHVLKSLRSAPVSTPLEGINRRPAWFPMQLRMAFRWRQLCELSSPAGGDATASFYEQLMLAKESTEKEVEGTLAPKFCKSIKNL